MIRGLVNGSIDPALRPHLKREYHISDDDLAQAAADGGRRSIATRRLVVAAVLPLLPHPVAYPGAAAAEAVDGPHIV